MNKSLNIRLAIAGLSLAAANAYAYDFSAEGNTLSVYGVLDGSVYVMKQSTAPSATTSTQSYGWASNNASTSRLGFGASRDLGAGLKIGGVVEQEVEFATGGSGDGATLASASTAAYGNTGTAQFNRAANIYVSDTGLGELRLGRQQSASYQLAISADAFGFNSGGYLYSYVFADNVLGGLLLTGKGAAAGNATINGSALTPNLYVNGLSYTSPSFDGVTVKLFQTFGSNDQPLSSSSGGSSNTGRPFSDGGITDLTVRYSGNGLGLGVGLQEVKASPTATSSYSGKVFSAVQLVANYVFGATKVSAAYNKVSFDGGFAAANGGADNITTYSLGATQKLTAADRVGLSFTDNKDSTNSASKQSLISLQYDRTLGKNADAYVQYVSSHQSGSGVLGLGGVYGATLPLTITNVNTVFAGAKFSF